MSHEVSASTLSFREFLKAKAGQPSVVEKRRRRKEWLDALHRFFDQIQEWLHHSDPDGLLEISPYEVARTEQQLGAYDAPAIRIQLGESKVDVLPIAREVPNSLSIGQSIATQAWQGRVDVTNGYKRFYLFREPADSGDRWRVRDEHDGFHELDSSSFERILQDLLS